MDTIEQLISLLEQKKLRRFRLLFEQHYSNQCARLHASALHPLTETETLICYQMALGFTVEMIKETMSCAASTIHSHAKHALHKLPSAEEGQRWLKTRVQAIFSSPPPRTHV